MAPAWLPFGLHGGLHGFAEWIFWLPSFYYHMWGHFSPVVVPVRAAPGANASATLTRFSLLHGR